MKIVIYTDKHTIKEYGDANGKTKSMKGRGGGSHVLSGSTPLFIGNAALQKGITRGTGGLVISASAQVRGRMI